MSHIRFELKNIADGMRELEAEEAEFVYKFISKNLMFTEMGDHLVPNRSILATRPGMTARVLGGSLGIGGGVFRSVD